MSNIIVQAAAEGLPKSIRPRGRPRKSAVMGIPISEEKPLLEIIPCRRFLPDGITLDDLPDVYVLNQSEAWRYDPSLTGLLRCIYSKTEPVLSGDICCLIYRIEVARNWNSQHFVKHLIEPIPDGVTFPYREQPGSGAWPTVHLENMTTAEDDFKVRCHDLLAIHKCLGPLPEGAPTVKCREYGQSITFTSDPRADFWRARRAAQ